MPKSIRQAAPALLYPLHLTQMDVGNLIFNDLSIHGLERSKG